MSELCLEQIKSVKARVKTKKKRAPCQAHCTVGVGSSVKSFLLDNTIGAFAAFPSSHNSVAIYKTLRRVNIFMYSRRTHLPDVDSYFLATRVSLRFAGDGTAMSFLQTLPL
jgi:hypothetical protein